MEGGEALVLDFDGDDVARLRVALARISRVMDRQISGAGMTRTQLSVLATIAHHGPLGVSELAAIEGLNPTMLSRVLAKLEPSGLVVRSSDDADRRAVRVQVTSAGARLHRRLRVERARLLTERLALLPPDCAAQIWAALPALEQLAAELSREAVAR
jgi:DNA-binding MarR family transcriptional regulator